MALSDCKLRESQEFKSLFDPIMETSMYIGIPGYILSTFTGFLIINYSQLKNSKYPSLFIGLLCLAQAIQVYSSLQYSNNYCQTWYN